MHLNPTWCNLMQPKPKQHVGADPRSLFLINFKGFNCPNKKKYDFPLLTTQSRPFLAVLNELRVGGWDPSTIHQPALALPHLPPKLSSILLPGAPYNQTVITPSGLPASLTYQPFAANLALPDIPSNLFMSWNAPLAPFVRIVIIGNKAQQRIYSQVAITDT